MDFFDGGAVGVARQRHVCLDRVARFVIVEAIIGKNLTLFLEGPAADAALGELLRIDGLSAEAVVSGDPPRRTDWLSLTANLLQVASAPVLARELLGWFRSRREKPGGAHFACVIECPDGSRLNLNAVTEEELAAILKAITRPAS